MEGKSLEKRALTRTKMVVALKVLKTQSESQNTLLLAHTLDISSVGAKIGGLRDFIEPGSVLLVQRNQTRARCRVVWSRKLGSGEIQLGIELIGRNTHFWGIDIDDNRAGVWLSASEL